MWNGFSYFFLPLLPQKKIIPHIIEYKKEEKITLLVL